MNEDESTISNFVTQEEATMMSDILDRMRG